MTATTTVGLFPIEPLARFAVGDTPPSPIALAAATGVDRRTIHRWRNAGGLSELQADRAAIALGVHPSAIWPDWDTP